MDKNSKQSSTNLSTSQERKSSQQNPASGYSTAHLESKREEVSISPLQIAWRENSYKDNEANQLEDVVICSRQTDECHPPSLGNTKQPV